MHSSSRPKEMLSVNSPVLLRSSDQEASSTYSKSVRKGYARWKMRFSSLDTAFMAVPSM